MKIKILYFARLKETLKFSAEDLDLADSEMSLIQLKGLLAKRGDVWQQMLLGNFKVRGAINHQLVDDHARIVDGDEVAFFPPVTGG